MTSMILINSADYVNPEFRNELGFIPPAFLPIGNKKLLSYQVVNLRKYFPNETNIILSLPKDYQLSIDEQRLVERLHVQIVLVKENVSLGTAILYVLNTVGYQESEILYLLHGDTLLNDLPTQKDCIALAKPQDNYSWEFDINSDLSLVWCGFFSISSIRLFIRELAITQGDFVQSVYSYAKQVQMKHVEVQEWHDLGHINTYFRSRSNITTQRAFNDLKIENGTVWKSGSPAKKIEAEAYWFENLPVRLKRFVPQFIQHGITDERISFYETEYLPCLPLNEIFVHGKNPTSFWENIFSLIALYMEESRRCFGGEQLKVKIDLDSEALYREKTYERLNLYAKQIGLDLDKSTRYNGIDLPSLNDIAKKCIDKTLSLPNVYAVSHGDLCFSNIMYDSRSHNIKVIDPRGLNFENEMTVFGNQTYDLAKLCHSVLGLYDFIISDSFEIKKSDDLGVLLEFNFTDRLSKIQNAFIEKQFLPNLDTRQIIPPTILLFLSMIPLHFDKPYRQEAMLANALRLYALYLK